MPTLRILTFLFLSTFCLGQELYNLDSLRNVFENTKDTLSRIDAGRRLWFTNLSFYNLCIYDNDEYLEKVNYYEKILIPLELASTQVPLKFNKEIDQLVYKMEYYQYSLKYDSLKYTSGIVGDKLQEYLNTDSSPEVIDKIISLITYKAILISYNNDLKESVNLFIKAIDLADTYDLTQREILTKYQLAYFLLNNFHNDSSTKLKALTILNQLEKELKTVENSEILDKEEFAEEILNTKELFKEDEERHYTIYLDPYSEYFFGEELYKKLRTNIENYHTTDGQEVTKKLFILKETATLLSQYNYENVYLYWQIQFYFGKHAYEQKEYDKAYSYLNKLNSLLEENRYINTALFNYEELYLMMKRISARNNQFEQAYYFAGKEYSYSLKNKDNASTSVINIVNRYEKARITELQDEIEAQRSKVMKSYFLIVILILGMFFFLYYIITKSKNNKKLNEKNIQLESYIQEKQKLQERIDKIQNSITNELHDNFGNRLSSIITSHNILKEINAQQQFDKKNFDHFSILLEKNLNNFTNDIKDLLWVNKKENNTLKKIIKRTNKFLRDISTDEPIKISLETNLYRENIELPKYWNRQLLLIIKEAVSNSVKHSASTQISVIVKVDENNKLEITISDNGKGFSLEELQRISGLNNMKIRAELIDCQLIIKSEKGVGTVIALLGQV